MFNLDATDKLEAIVASDTNKVMFTVSGHDATSGVISSQGYVTTSNTEIYDAVGATRIYSFTAYNSHTSAITITLNKDPGDVGTLWTFFKVSLGAGYSLHFDGQRCSVLDASGNLLTSFANLISDTAYAASWDTVTTIAPSKNAVYDQMELRAPKASPTFSGDVTLSAGDIIMTDGQGVDFSGVAGGGAVSSLLDDYEEGTCTITAADASSGGNTSDTAVAQYTKNGDIVTLNLRMININTTPLTGGNIAYFRGLPYPTKALVYVTGTPVLHNVTLANNYVSAYTIAGVSYFFFKDMKTGDSPANLLVSDFADDTADIYMTLVYKTDT